MQHSDNYTYIQSICAQLLRAAVGLGALGLISACGGGGGGAAPAAVPAQLGAALPEAGDFIAVVQESINLSESARTGNVVVTRQGQVSGASSVHYRFVAGSAVAGTDFKGVNGSLNWADGESGDRSIQFLVESDLLSEGDEGFQIELFDAKGNNALGINDSVAVTITDSACSASIPTSMTSSTVLSAPCYQLNGNARFGPSGLLSISPGTTIIAAPESSITLIGSATIQSEGQRFLPVTMKGADNMPGEWNGLALQSSSALHRIGYTEIRNAKNAVQLQAGGLALFNNNVLRDNSGAGVRVPLKDVDTLQTQNTFINTVRGIELVGSSIDQGQTITLPAQSTHYVLSNGLIISGTLELVAGTDLRMGADVPVLVLNKGAISATGTAGNPINISGVEPQQGYWNGIQYVSSSSTANRFEHVTIAHGGGDPARPGNIIIEGLDTAVSMQQCALNDSAGYGIVYESTSFQVDLNDVTFQGNRLGEQSM